VHALPPIKPHIVVPVAALARLLPADVGIALNPGAGDSDAKDAVVQVVERAALAAPTDPRFPIDVTFPGEYSGGASMPDPVDEWVSAFATPFYRRD
jgi:hypothetical protein